MIHNVCALTRIPIRDGDDVVMLLPDKISLGRGGWDRTCPAIDLVERFAYGVYHCGWVAGLEPPDGEASLLLAIFVHSLAWHVASQHGSGKDALERVIDFAVRAGVRLDHAIDLKSTRPEAEKASILALLDVADELARRL